VTVPGRSRLAHAVRVAGATGLLIASAYVVVTVVFDVVDSAHLVAQVDAHLKDRLHDVVVNGVLTRPPGEADDDHDVEAAPVLLWRIGPTGRAEALSDGAPALPRAAWSSQGRASTAQLGRTSFRLLAVREHGAWLVAGQSLADTDHVGAVLVAAEAIAGPVVVVAAFLGALVIGLQASRPVEEARRRQLEFTADASHELRTPLSVIEAEVSLALGSPRSAERYHDTLERVGAESRRLRDIIEDLLWLARFDSEPAPPRAELVDLEAVARSGAERFGAVAGARGTTISVERRGDTAAGVVAPPDWLDRLVGVLVDNACRYAGPGGRVRVVVTGHATRVVLSVQDSGPGIPVAERTRLFDRFHRVTDDGSGTGLGLAIADSVVRATGGRWRIAESTLGGADMEVTWHRSSSRDAGHPPHRAAPNPLTVATGPLRQH